jgi:hypothetical protein
MRLQRIFTGILISGLLPSVPALALPLPAVAVKTHATLLLFGRQKTITVNLRNDSAETLELRNGDSLLKLEPGKTIALSLPLGQRVVFEKPTSKHAAGDVLVEGVSDRDQATIVVH